LPQFVGEARAGGGGGGGCISVMSYAYDAAGRLTCVYSNCAGTGVNYNYDSVGNLRSITTTSTSCPQNTMRDVIANKALASSRRVPAITTRRTHQKSVRVARDGVEKLNNLAATVQSRQQLKEKPLAVAAR